MSVLNLSLTFQTLPIPMAPQSKSSTFDRSFAGITGSNPAEWMDVRLFECCVFCGRGLCVGLITRPGKADLYTDVRNNSQTL